MRQGYASSYTLTGCRNAADCGVYMVVSARCPSFRCNDPTAYGRPGYGDPALCDGAPVYQQQTLDGSGGRVLLRTYNGPSTLESTQWHVTDSSHLDDCGYGNDGIDSFTNSWTGRGFPPDDQHYRCDVHGQSCPSPGWRDHGSDNDNFRVTAGGGH